MISPQPAGRGNAAARRRDWVTALLSAGLAILAVAPVFTAEIADAVHVWSASTAYNHCFLVLPIVIALIWMRRAALADVAPRPRPPGLLAVGLLSLAWLIAARLDVVEARQFLFIGIVETILYTLLGREVFGRLLGPLLYLFFLVPSGAVLIPALQDFTARFAVAGLHLSGVPVFSDGISIEIPEGNFVIAEACAGLRFLIASLAYGVFFALLVYRSPARRLAFVALSAGVPILANGLRAFGIILAAHVFGSARAAVADHVLYGWLFFSLVIMLLTLMGMSLSEHAATAPSQPGSADAAPPLSPLRQSLLAGGAVLLAAGGPVYAASVSMPTAAANARVRDLPAPGGGWREATGDIDWRPAAPGADGIFRDSYTDGTRRVDRFVAIYETHGMTNAVARSTDPAADDETVPDETHIVTATIGGRDLPVAVSEIRSGAATRIVWSFYIVDGHIAADGPSARLYRAYAGLLGRGGVAAFVAVSTRETENTSKAGDILAPFLARMMPGALAALR